jgi:hypothetical protein
VVAYEFLLLAGLAFSIMTNNAHRTMNSWVGLFAVASVLYIYGTGELALPSSRGRRLAPHTHGHCSVAGGRPLLDGWRARWRGQWARCPPPG